MIFLLVLDIDEWNNLSLKNNITVKKKRQNIEDENDHIFSTLFGDKDFISQESLILADFENITYYWIKIYPLRQAKKLLECNQYPSSFRKKIIIKKFNI